MGLIGCDQVSYRGMMGSELFNNVVTQKPFQASKLSNSVT